MPAEHTHSNLPAEAEGGNVTTKLAYIDQMLEIERQKEKEPGGRLFWDEDRERTKQRKEREEEERVIENSKEMG